MIHLQKEIEKLKRMILALSAVIEEDVQKAVRSFEKREVGLAKAVIGGDMDIDQKEVEVEEECLKILALYQPVAIDLRYIVAVLKINNDLERIGDLAVNIAERATFMARMDRIEAPFNITEMTQKAQAMLRKSLDAFVNMDADLAADVCSADDEIDDLNRQVYRIIGEKMRESPERFDAFVQYLSISRYIERIADHATNIAEDVIYMIKGEIVRHRADVCEPAG